MKPAPLACAELGALALAPGEGPPHLSAASGLVETGGALWVVADDELSLGVFPSGGGAGRLVRLFAGALPEEHRARKAAKPDLEALALLPPAAGLPHGALLAVGSGSTPARTRGALLPLGGDGAPEGAATEVDLAPVHEALARAFPALNLEGAAVSGDTLVLLQRANGPGAVSGRAALHLAAAIEGARRGRIEATALRSVERLSLPSLGGVPLGFTDACPFGDGRLLFAAAAEAGGSTYEDGVVSGAALGILGPGGVEALWPLGCVEKVEGVWRRGGEVLLVTDADDRAKPSRLLRTTLPR